MWRCSWADASSSTPLGVELLAMYAKKVTVRKKRGRQFDEREIEIPSDEAMIDVAQR
jgi:hypothetical protein